MKTNHFGVTPWLESSTSASVADPKEQHEPMAYKASDESWRLNQRSVGMLAAGKRLNIAFLMVH